MEKQDAINTALPCNYIHAKNSFGMIENSDSWSGISDPNATYWCSKTGGPTGPDNNIVSPYSCKKTRKCFTSESSGQ